MRSRVRGSLTSAERGLLDELVRELGPRLLAYIRRVYGNEHDAEDIVAETFCRAARNITALQASNRRDLYVLTIARNLCRDGFRRQRPISLPHERLQQNPAPISEPSRMIVGDEQTQALRAAVAGLPENLREVVVLRFSGGLKFEQIAELLHIPLGTALSRMHAAVGRLRETLGVRP
ncbi:MAG: sigma-70 family RNA polymerase sigma factor [Phycisphaerae bacterium]|nr:sigma-70 family RNA polymerase sigma factor [Phycisphaerae bacterium]